jgi:hypothetical protein
MKGKKYSTKDKIRILRQADGGEAIQAVCREQNSAPSPAQSPSGLLTPGMDKTKPST